MKGRRSRVEITFHVVWRELPSEALMIEAGAITLRDHLERRARLELLQREARSEPE